MTECILPSIICFNFAFTLRFSPSTLKKLLSIVEDEVETHMGFSASKKRESKLTQWSRRKRAGLGSAPTLSVDPVDDLLKSELRTEEADWVNYESEEFHVRRSFILF